MYLINALCGAYHLSATIRRTFGYTYCRHKRLLRAKRSHTLRVDAMPTGMVGWCAGTNRSIEKDEKKMGKNGQNDFAIHEVRSSKSIDCCERKHDVIQKSSLIRLFSFFYYRGISILFLRKYNAYFFTVHRPRSKFFFFVSVHFLLLQNDLLQPPIVYERRGKLWLKENTKQRRLASHPKIYRMAK